MIWEYERIRDSYITPFCSHAHMSEARHVSAHLHYNIEALYLAAGEMTVILYDNASISHSIVIHAGELLLVNSSVVHATVTAGAFENYIVFIPPNCIPPALRFSVGKTPCRPVPDPGGVIRGLLDHMYEISREAGFKNLSESPDIVISEYQHTRLTLLLGAILSLIHEPISASLIDIRCASDEIDLLKYVYGYYRSPDLTVGKLCTAFGYTPKALSRFFIKHTGVGVKRYIDRLRINDAKRMLIDSDACIDVVASEVGYDCVRTFYRIFSAYTGTSPDSFRKNNRDFREA